VFIRRAVGKFSEAWRGTVRRGWYGVALFCQLPKLLRKGWYVPRAPPQIQFPRLFLATKARLHLLKTLKTALRCARDGLCCAWCFARTVLASLVTRGAMLCGVLSDGPRGNLFCECVCAPSVRKFLLASRLNHWSRNQFERPSHQTAPARLDKRAVAHNYTCGYPAGRLIGA
jgi:hypothetical protein